MAVPRKGNSAARSKGAIRPVVAVIGYGPQGRALTRNLSDSGYEVVVGLRAGSNSVGRARRDGLKSVKTVAAAVRSAEVVCFAFPDHLHGRVFKRSIAPNLKRQATLWFLHGTSIHFGLVQPPKSCDVILIAPHAPGNAVRDAYLTDRSLSAFYGVYQKRSKRAFDTARKLAAAAGVKRERLVKTTFAREAVGDLFGEQAVLCGGLAMLIKHGFETLVDRGWKPENAWLEVAYQLDLIVALIKRHGIAGMLKRISPAARLGSFEAGPAIIDGSVRNRMENQLERILSGAFAEKLAALDDNALAALNRSLRQLTDPRLEKAARKFRS